MMLVNCLIFKSSPHKLHMSTFHRFSKFVNCWITYVHVYDFASESNFLVFSNLSQLTPFVCLGNYIHPFAFGRKNILHHINPISWYCRSFHDCKEDSSDEHTICASESSNYYSKRYTFGCNHLQLQVLEYTSCPQSPFRNLCGNLYSCHIVQLRLCIRTSILQEFHLYVCKMWLPHSTQTHAIICFLNFAWRCYVNPQWVLYYFIFVFFRKSGNYTHVIPIELSAKTPQSLLDTFEQQLIEGVHRMVRI